MITKNNSPTILLINPYIHDFAAYDFWAKPLGLLILGGILLQHDYNVEYIDCLDRFHPNNKKNINCKIDGRGSYLKQRIKKPESLFDVSRNYSCYGIPKEWFIEDLKNINKPDLILITSLMSYWYPGVIETVDILNQIFPDTPIVMGGIYASLCYEHALKNFNVNEIIKGPGEPLILDIVSKYTKNFTKSLFDPDDLNTYPYPALYLQNKIKYVPLLTVRGCPYSCHYCASSYLTKKIRFRSPDNVIEEILFWHKKYNVENFAFYDDALLIQSEKHAKIIFEKIINLNLQLKFHCPNALHIKEISFEIANLMFKAGFETIRLGLETSDFDSRDDFKVNYNNFINALNNLKKSGFNKNQIGAYLLAGCPEQNIEQICRSIQFVKTADIQPVLAYYSPIPHTQMWSRAKLSSRYDLESDPIYTNNSIFPCKKENFSWEKINMFKKILND